MTSRYSIILSFILATLFVTGAVELFYRSVDKVIQTSEKTLKKDVEKVALFPSKRTAAQQTDALIALKNTDYTIITKRNLFGKASGTTSTISSTTAPILVTTSLDLMLLGTIQGSADTQRAIIRNKKSQKQAIYSRGDSIEHALIKEIMRGKIILTVNGKDEILLMGELKSPPPTVRKIPSIPKRTIAQPDVYTPDHSNENEATVEQSPPLAVPKRRLTLQPIRQPAEE